MASDNEIEEAAKVLYDGDWMGTVDRVGKDAARTIARRILDAAERVREPVIFVTADYFPGPQLRCTVNGPQHIAVERLPSPPGQESP